MEIKRRTLAAMAALTLAGGALALAQQPGHGPGPGGFMGGRMNGRHIEMLATQLGLTDSQKEQAKTIFADARKAAEPIGTQMKTAHESLQAAVKENKSDAELDRLAAAQGTLTGQLAATYAKAFAKFYAILTPEQREKADTLHSNMRGMLQRRFGPRG